MYRRGGASVGTRGRNGRFFLDTNIFVYSFDASSPKKAAQARKLIRSAIETRSGIVSYQVLQEFFNVALVRFANRRFCNRGSMWSSLQRRLSGWTADWKRDDLQPLCLTEGHPCESRIAGEENNGSEGACSKPFQVIENWLRGLQPSELFSAAF